LKSAEKFNCSLPEHKNREDCISDLENIRVASQVASNQLEKHVTCFLARLKHRIIRLRRGNTSDWPYFSSEVKNNVALICDSVNTRWLISILDTFIDYGDALEKSQALAIVTLVNWEKLALTQRTASGQYPESEPNKEGLDTIRNRHGILWDGMDCMLLEGKGDLLINLFKRIIATLKVQPLFLRLFETLFERIVEHEYSTLSWVAAEMRIDVIARIREMFVEAYSLTSTARGMLNAQHDPSKSNQGSRIAEKLTAVEQRLQRIERSFLVKNAVESETRYRDQLQLSLKPMLEKQPAFSLETSFPVAERSCDHLFPRETAQENMRAPRFVAGCESLFNEPVRLLDLGTAGGGLVLDFILGGHIAIGLEGSDYSQKKQRAEWRTLPDQLFTCDITHPFTVWNEETIRKRASFNIVTAWSLLDRINKKDLPTVFANIRNHLDDNGLLMGSVAFVPSARTPDGSSYRKIVEDKQWWLELLRFEQFEVLHEHPFDPAIYPRDNGASSIGTENFIDNPERGLIFTAALKQ